MAIMKTYGVNGLMEWEALIPSGKITLAVQFTGGTLTGYGVTPALFSTDNPIFQQIIERSNYFKSGRIKIIRTVETEAPAPLRSPVATPVAPPKESPAQDTAAMVDGDGGDVRRVEVTDRSMAKNYMMDNYGLSPNTLRSRAEIERAAKARGIEFVGLE